MHVNWNAVNNELSETLLEADRLEELLSELGCELRGIPGGDRFRGACPIHLGDDDNFEVRTDGHTLPIYWTCFSQGCQNRPELKNNLLGLVRGTLSSAKRLVGLREAREFVENFLARAGNTVRVKKVRKPPVRKSPSWPREQVRAQLTIPSPYFLSRGFCPEVLDSLDIGDSDKLGRAVVPVYDDLGSACVGSVSRSVHPTCATCGLCHRVFARCGWGEARWRVQEGFPCGEWLYNYAACRSPGPYVLLVEGVPDVLRATEAGVPAVAAFGTTLSAAQTRKLAALRRMVVVAFDNDEPGRSAAARVRKRLANAGVWAEVRSPPHGYKDIGETPASDVACWARQTLPA